MEKILATVITIGDELLIGQTIDTNSAWIGGQLNTAGIWLHRRVAVGDDREAILKALREESAAADIVLITGGLGPTADDITKPVLCEYFETGLVLHEETWQQVQRLLSGRGLPMLERNRLQAMVPEACTVLPNRRGTAPGMWFEKEGTVFVSMPGVPHEMQGIMEEEVLPRLRRYFKQPPILHRTLLTAGQGESYVAERLVGFEAQLPATIKLAYLPGSGLLKLRLTVTGGVSGGEQLLERHFQTLQQLLADITLAAEDISREALLGRLLKERGKTVGTAESCTGGYIAHCITSVPGSSSWYKGSVVCYANEVKQQVLGVEGTVLKQEGAVSEAVVRRMVSGALELLQTDYVLAVSGIMGPDGGTPTKPVGTVWIAAGGDNRVEALSYHLRYDRGRNIQLTAHYAMNLLIKRLLREAD